MPEPVNLAYAFGLSPRAAIEYFTAKGYVISWNWDDVWQAAHAKAFTVAKVTSMEVLKDIRGALDTALREGKTLQQFRAELEPLLRARGWWGPRVEQRPDGTAQLINVSSPWRLKTIYQTNLQSAYMAGRWETMRRNAASRPYWMYVAVMDSRTRPTHAAMNGKVFRIDDPRAARLYPPNDFNCRCRARALSERDLARRGLKVARDDDLTVFESVDVRTGQVYDVASYQDAGMRQAFAPGKGWSYNAGQAAFQPNLEQATVAEARAYLAQSVSGPAFARFIEGKDGGYMPVAVLAKEYQALIGANAQTVVFSTDSRDKNLARHPELTLADYQRLPDVIGNAQLIVKDGDQTIVFVRREDRLYRAVIRATQSGQAVFMTSFRIANLQDVERLRRAGQVLKDEL